MQYGLGAIPDKEDIRDFKYRDAAPSMALTALPEVVDYRDRFSIATNQMPSNACVGWAAAAMFEFYQPRSFAASPYFIYYTARERMGIRNPGTGQMWVDIDGGASNREAIKAMTALGVCYEPFWKIDYRNINIKPHSSAYMDAAKRKVKSYFALDKNPAQICQALADGNPVMLAWTFYQSAVKFPINDGIGRIRMPEAGDTPRGLHSIVLGGYNQKDRVFYFKNSWGFPWGRQGWGEFPFDYPYYNDIWTIRLQ